MWYLDVNSEKTDFLILSPPDDIHLILKLAPVLSKKSEKMHLAHTFCSSTRLREVPHFSSGIVERAKREHAWKSPHARKGETRWGKRKMRDYRQSPSFDTSRLTDFGVWSSYPLPNQLSASNGIPSLIELSLLLSSASKCDFCPLFQTERSWHEY